MKHIDLWPLFWVALVVSVSHCTYKETESYNDCVKADKVLCSRNT